MKQYQFFLPKFFLLFFFVTISMSVFAQNVAEVDSIQIHTVNGYTFKMIFVEGGIFQMGSNDGDYDEKPVHSVTLDSYYLAEFELTQGLWKAVMGEYHDYFDGENFPVGLVNWYDCVAFCNALSEEMGLSPYYNIHGDSTDLNNIGDSDRIKRLVTINDNSNGFRLPTEAEWEFAARGGNKSNGYKYSGSDNIDSVVWRDHNPDVCTYLVGQKNPNELGFYDMSGNVSEWCWDWFGAYRDKPLINPARSKKGTWRVIRDSSSSVIGCRVSSRHGILPDDDDVCTLGFRIARSF